MFLEVDFDQETYEDELREIPNIRVCQAAMMRLAVNLFSTSTSRGESRTSQGKKVFRPLTVSDPDSIL